ARLQAAPGRCRVGNSCRTPDDRVDGPGEVTPLALLLHEHAPALRRRLVYAPAPAVDLGPSTGGDTRALQPVQRRIKRAFRQVECAIAAGAECFGDRIAVRRFMLHGGEEQQIEMAFEYLRPHTS